MIIFLRKILPPSVIQWLIRLRFLPEIHREIKYLKRKVLRFSMTFDHKRGSLLSDIMIRSHVLEKGITMPERRLGFGYDRVRALISKVKKYLDQYGAEEVFLQAAIADLKQYRDIHVEAGFQLPEDIDKGISSFLPFLVVDDANCFVTTREEYFKPCDNFADFAESRHSVRWFADSPVDEDKLMAAIHLAQTAPSACNRQSTRVKIVSSDAGKLLCQSLQHGNRGFGDKADKWLLITTDLGDWPHNNVEMAYIDAGIFTMNLLYALHHYGFVACTLNAHMDIPKREELYKGLGVPESELLAAFIIVGNPAESFMIPKSRRLDVKDIVQVI